MDIFSDIDNFNCLDCVFCFDAAIKVDDIMVTISLIMEVGLWMLFLFLAEPFLEPRLH